MGKATELGVFLCALSSVRPEVLVNLSGIVCSGYEGKKLESPDVTAVVLTLWRSLVLELARFGFEPKAIGCKGTAEW